MIHKEFTCGSDARREITIVIEDIFIVFYLDGQTESSFYDFYKDDWVNFKTHMEEKSWFTAEMSDFINSAV